MGAASKTWVHASGSTKSPSAANPESDAVRCECTMTRAPSPRRPYGETIICHRERNKATLDDIERR